MLGRGMGGAVSTSRAERWETLNCHVGRKDPPTEVVAFRERELTRSNPVGRE